MKELWRPVKSWVDLYEISNLGKLRLRKDRAGFKKGYIFKPYHILGYEWVGLYKNGKRVKKAVAFLVLQAFLGKRPKGLFINHKNGSRDDNRIENLEYVTPSENNKHAFRIGLNKHIGSGHHSTKLTLEEAKELKKKIALGIKDKKLAREYGFKSENSIIQIKKGLTYAYA